MTESESEPVPDLIEYKTCRRFNEVGHAHALTFSCFHRKSYLTGERACSWLAEAINAASGKHAFDVWAYVFMPEHVHLLICPRQDKYDVSKFLASVKLPVTRKACAYATQYAPEFLP